MSHGDAGAGAAGPRLRARLLVAASALGVLGCSDADDRGGTAAPSAPAAVRFVSRLSGSGVDFHHDHGGCGRKYFPEINAGGVSLFDYDGDGDLDLYFPQGAPLPGYQPPGELLDRLYRNDGGFRFTDVTLESGAGETGYTFSAACPDIDGDGDLDLYLCNYGKNTLLVNDGRGRFTDATDASGLGCEAWSSCAAFADLDGDGDLDVYVGNYVVYDLAHAKPCGELAKGPQYLAYCHPDTCPGARDELYRNDGGRDGAVRFTPITAAAGMEKATGKALAVVPADIDDDGDVDLFVANDHVPNFLWRNDGAMKFTNVAFDLGCAQDGHGRSESCMGSDIADVEGDGDLDIFTATMAMETNTLWINDDGLFTDDTDLAGLGAPSLLYVGFGAKFLDQDLDGDPDLAVANGHVMDNIELYDAHQTLKQPAHFYENVGRGKFRLPGKGAGAWPAGAYFDEAHVGRGLAAGDLDNDGDTDLVFANWASPPELLENTTIGAGRAAPRWLGLELRAKGANTRALGARVACTAIGTTQIAEVRGTGSYAAWNDTRLVFGLGAATGPLTADVTIRWPDGTRQPLTGLAIDRYHTIRQP